MFLFFLFVSVFGVRWGVCGGVELGVGEWGNGGVSRC